MSPEEDATFAAAMLIAPRLNALPWMELASTSRACRISESYFVFSVDVGRGGRQTRARRRG